MSIENNNNFYNLELEEFKESRHKIEENLEKKQKYYSRRRGYYSDYEIISKEKLMLILIMVVLFLVIFPIAQAYIVKSRISATMQEIEEELKEVIFAMRFDKLLDNASLPRHVYVDQYNSTRRVTIDIGQTGKKIVNGTGYLVLIPSINTKTDTVQWKCTAFGTGIQENYLPNNCKLIKQPKNINIKK
ncbi:MAG: hypothetical protein Kow0076_1330 [Francisella sp.]